MMAVRETLSLDGTIRFLNGLVRLDRKAMDRLLAARVPCNTKFAKHPTVQVGCKRRGERIWECRVGLLGVLNGLFGIYGPNSKRPWFGPIMAVMSDKGRLLRFQRTLPSTKGLRG